MKHWINILLCLLVIRCLDGDTFQLDNGMKIRIAAIDAPEKKQDTGPASKAYLESLILNKEVILKCHGVTYDRNVCFVSLDGQDIGSKMVFEGRAYQAQEQYSHGVYTAVEKDAEEHKRGVWANPEAQKPWEFRHHE